MRATLALNGLIKVIGTTQTFINIFLVSLLLILNLFQTFRSVPTVDFEQVNARLEIAFSRHLQPDQQYFFVVLRLETARSKSKKETVETQT